MRVGRAIEKTEEEVAKSLMSQLKKRGHPDVPPGIATDGKGSYREAMVETWGKTPDYSGHGRRPSCKQAQPEWRYLQVIKHRNGSWLTGVTTKVIYGEVEEVEALLGKHTSYVERTNLTSRQMNGRLVRKTLSFSKELEMLKSSCAWEDWAYNLTRPVKTLRKKIVENDKYHFEPCSPAMAAGLTDHIWTIKELVTTVVIPHIVNTE